MADLPYCDNCYDRVKAKPSDKTKCTGDVEKTGKPAQCPIKYDGDYKFEQQCGQPIQQYIEADLAVISDRSATAKKCMTLTQKKHMHYTLMSKCTNSDTPPSGPGWKDFRTSVKLNLLTADCRADTTCELW